MRRDHADLTIAAGLTIGAAAVLLPIELAAAAGPVWAVMQVVAGLPLVLVLPGYALSTLLLPAASGRPRFINPLLWRGMWAVGLSLAVTALGGLALNLTPAGLTRASWTIALAVLVLLALAASATLRARRARSRSLSPATAPLHPAQAPGRPTAAAARTRAPALATASCALAALLLAGAAIWLAASGTAGPRRISDFAQLWLVPAQSATGKATLGLRSAYPHAERFRLVLLRDGRTAATWDLALAARQAWQTTISAPAGQRLRAELTMAGQRTAPLAVDVRLGGAP
jgi:Protein of unknown function (DUF1616)